jgi:ribosomal protein S18 acetylase RimI-like enzyme
VRVVTIRAVDLAHDRAGLLALDRSFTTEIVYRVVRTADGFALEEVPVSPALRKEFPLAGDLGDERAWEEGIVAQSDGTIAGFAAWTHRWWNRRTEIWHLYVAPPARGQGLGRALVDEVIAAAQAAGMRCVWLETSTVAYPAIQFYRRLGFVWCGLDTALYDPAHVMPGEMALYFAQALPAPGV